MKRVESQSEVFSDRKIKDIADQMWEEYSVDEAELKNFKGRVVAESKMEEGLIFRGQTHDYGSLRAGVYRTDNVYEQAVREAKRLEMDLMLSKVPYAEDSILKVLPVAISQHYGLRTDYLDFTGSLKVALFFATCQWDPEVRRYRPLTREEIEKHPIGIIYLTIPKGTLVEKLEIIGTSSLNRPSCQYGYMIHDDGSGLGGGMFGTIKFRQSTWLSNDTYHFFDDGESIMPSQDSRSLLEIMDEMNESKAVNKPLFLSVCRQKGLKGTDEELIAGAKGYEMADKIRFLSPEVIEQSVSEIRKYNYIERTNAKFIIRPRHAIS